MYRAPHHIVYRAPHHIVYRAPHHTVYRAPHHTVYRAPHHIVYTAPHGITLCIEHPITLCTYSQYVVHSIAYFFLHCLLTFFFIAFACSLRMAFKLFSSAFNWSRSLWYLLFTSLTFSSLRSAPRRETVGERQQTGLMHVRCKIMYKCVCITIQ